jgi:hypothetical protein
VKYYFRTNRTPRAEGPFDLDGARSRLRTALRAAHGQGHAVHEGQRGMWLLSGADGADAELIWIADEKHGIVRLDDRAGQPSFLH